jgi:transposase-like protein
MAPLPMRCLIEKVVRFARAETVRLTGPTELDLTVPDQAKFVICNHTIEQDHRAVKWVTRPMLGFKSFDAAQDTLVGIERMHMLKKRQMVVEAGEESLTAAEPFYSLAA